MMIKKEDILAKIKKIRPNAVGGEISPHKYLFLLTLVKLNEINPNRSNEYPLNLELENTFINVCNEFYPDNSPEKIFIEYPFYHLTNDQIWSLVIKSGKESLFDSYKDSPHKRPTKNRLIETVEYGKLSDDIAAILKDAEYRDLLSAELIKTIKEILNPHVRKKGESIFLKRIQLVDSIGECKNEFVNYLNSLQLLNAANENALAEFQACSLLFNQIHVPHQITNKIIDELLNSGGRQVILTGHAGDGKTTIALDVFKALSKLPPEKPLIGHLAPRENISGTNISIIKDLSERQRLEDPAFVKELLGNTTRFLIVSNTGALLDLFRSNARILGSSAIQVESDVLDVISNEKGEAELKLGNVRFLVFNLARMDNLNMAQQIFLRMIAPERWEACKDLACRSNCPIYMNIELISSRKELVCNRLFLAYRRMYEYGTRLTLRQLTEHMAYMITSGLQEKDLKEMQRKKEAPLKVEFMFFNRFFGDNGKVEHSGALQMRAVREVLGQRFGERPCPTWERKLWLRLRGRNFKIGIESCEEEFGLLIDHGSGPGSSSQPGLSPDQAREQVRRMLYFLYDFNSEEQSFISNFLNSPYLLNWQAWQSTGTQLGLQEKNLLEQRIFHVLQEHFTGVRLPEGLRGSDRRLYITLSRKKSEIRQSAQVVLAQVDWSQEFVLKLVEKINAAGGSRIDLELHGDKRLQGASLVLTLPFLDYMVMRHFGELGETLKAAYVERLERFKAHIQELAKESREHVMLVRLKTDHTFRRQHYAIAGGKLEVSDVL